MSECELIVFISTVACALAKCCTADELTILSVVFTQLGDSISTILAKRELDDKKFSDNKIDDNDKCERDSSD